jgi:hypothetical protein
MKNSSCARAIERIIGPQKQPQRADFRATFLLEPNASGEALEYIANRVQKAAENIYAYCVITSPAINQPSQVEWRFIADAR